MGNTNNTMEETMNKTMENAFKNAPLPMFVNTIPKKYNTINVEPDEDVTFYVICKNYSTKEPIGSYTFLWSPSIGYIHMHHNRDTNINPIGTPLESGADIDFMYPENVLQALTKATGYDYLNHGKYSLELINQEGESYYVPKHWLVGVPHECYTGYKLSEPIGVWVSRLASSAPISNITIEN